MSEIKKSVVDSLDGTTVELYTYLPYILQDLWEIGADPATMLSLLNENIKNTGLRILDLGCGKGSVSVHIARYLDCTVKGIDAMPAFVESARAFAEKFKVQEQCDFEVGDIRSDIKEMRNFDVVILGAIGPVLGDLYTTLKILSQSLVPYGYVLLDDGYLEDESAIQYERCLRKSEFYNQIRSAGYQVVQEVIFTRDKIKESDDEIYKAIERRINELIIKYPDKRDIFIKYLKSQAYENQILENELITGTWLLKKRN